MVSFILSALDVAGIPLTASHSSAVPGHRHRFRRTEFLSTTSSAASFLMFTKPIPHERHHRDPDGLFASVEEIGSRSTHVKTFDNIDVLVRTAIS
jgi:hypothetical protein